MIKYYIQKIFGRLFDQPIFRQGRSIGYSLVKSERSHFKCGANVEIIPPCFLHDVTIGDYSYIAKGSNASFLRLGKFCSVGPNFVCGMGIHPTNGLSTSPMFYSTIPQNGVTLAKEMKIKEHLFTEIGNDVFIGANVTILDGVKIGNGAVIGAGAVVVKDIPPYAIAVGVPAKVVKYRFNEEIISKLESIQWWNWPVERLPEVERYFGDIDLFIDKFYK